MHEISENYVVEGAEIDVMSSDSYVKIDKLYKHEFSTPGDTGKMRWLKLCIFSVKEYNLSILIWTLLKYSPSSLINFVISSVVK